jgi:hypothetical protein
MTPSQPSTRVRFAQKQAERFREDVGDWQSEHEPVVMSIEDVVSAGSYYLRTIIRRLPGDIEERLGVRYALRKWLETSQQVVAHLEDLEKEGGQIEGAALLRSNVEMVHSLLDSARAIHIDEHGQVFELSGERVILAGLTPEDVLESLEDERQGRVYPLAEITSSRDEHGV